jgi:hypothetical protein
MTRRFLPGVPDLVFGLILISVLIGGRHGMLNDPGTLWHLRLGREILASHQVPHADSFTYTRSNAQWIDQSWLFDLTLAGIVDFGGWSAAVGLGAALLAGVYARLASGLLRQGAAPLVVLLVTLVVAGVGAIHFLIRPHLFTLAFFVLTQQICRAQHERGGWRVLSAVPLVAVWANLHGGFLSGPIIVFSAGFAHAISGRWDRSRRIAVARFFGVGVLCVFAALINPYGIGLYGHVTNLLLNSGVTALIDEYQPIPFGKPNTRAVELILIAMISVPTFTRGRMTRYDLVHSLAWLHLGLAAVRNAPLFALAAAPGLCGLFSPVSKPEPDSERSAEPVEPIPSGGWTVWPAALTMGVLIAVASGASIGAFDPANWPLSALPALNRLPSEGALFHEQDWGGLVEAETRPTRRAFIDDRFELYGLDEVQKYLNAIEGGPDWDQLAARYSPSIVWIRPARGLARRLANDPSWRERHRDKVSVIFERVGPNEDTRRLAVGRPSDR